MSSLLRPLQVLRVRVRPAALAVLFALAACNGGGGGGGDRGPATPSTPQPLGSVQVFPNPGDARLMQTIDDQGNKVLFLGVKDELGRVERATRAVITPLDADPVRVDLDEQQRPERLELADGSGLRIDWPENGLVRIRYFDTSGVIVVDAWFDALTGQMASAPAALTLAGDTALAPAAPVGSLQPLLLGDDALQVTVRIDGCDGQPCGACASQAKLVSVEFATPLGNFEVTAERDGGVYRATLPRNLTPYEWRTDQCERMLEWTQSLCAPFADPVVSGLLLDGCANPFISLSPVAAAVCFYGQIALNLYCLSPTFSAEVLCTTAVIATDPFGSMWTVPGQRTLRARAHFAGCSGTELRISAPVVVTNADHAVTLVVDGCLPDPPSSWNAFATTDVVGVVTAGSGMQPQVFDPFNPQLGYVTVAAIPQLGPRINATACYWPPTRDPIYEVTIEKTATMAVELAAEGGLLSVSLGISRAGEQLRAPTQEEVQAGLADGGQYCLEMPVRLESGLTALYSVRIRPFQRLVVDLMLQGDGNPDAVHELRMVQMWPSVVGAAQEVVLTGSGQAQVVVTHDQVRAAWEQVFGQLPQVPGLPVPGANDESQCYDVLFAINAGVTLEVGENIYGTTEGAAAYTVRVEYD